MFTKKKLKQPRVESRTPQHTSQTLQRIQNREPPPPPHPPPPPPPPKKMLHHYIGEPRVLFFVDPLEGSILKGSILTNMCVYIYIYIHKHFYIVLGAASPHCCVHVRRDTDSFFKCHWHCQTGVVSRIARALKS